MKEYKLAFIIGTCFLMMQFLIAGIFSIQTMQENTEQRATEAKFLIEERIDETLKLLLSLAKIDFFTSNSATYIEKSELLKEFNLEYEYMMIRILDEKMNVYNEKIGKAANLASRDYIQSLCATGNPQITDVFLAGADGQTPNYTVVVPIKANEKITGGIFAAIHESEFQTIANDKKVKWS